MNYHITSYLATGNPPIRCGTGTPFIAPYEVFPASDEGLLVCVGNDNLFQRFTEALGIPEIAENDLFATNPMRVQNRQELRTFINERFKTRTASEWEKSFNDRSIPCSRILSVADLVQNDQFQALNLMKLYPHPAISDLRLIDLPVSQNKKRAAYHHSPPLLGEQTDQILKEIGYSESEITTLRNNHVVA